MSILVYKRTHTGDPNTKGVFGVYDCMGSLRDLQYEAVIGIGGYGNEPRSFKIDGKITWVGVNPTKRDLNGFRGPQVTFQYFLLFDAEGPLLYTFAPLLAKRMYEGRVRYLLNGYTESERKEAQEIINWAIKVSKHVSGKKDIECSGYKLRCVCRNSRPLQRSNNVDIEAL
ncbi:MAG: hypothetical protein HGB11_15375 [Chlorobiales bacterium]|nr:hypothetical protein [Chlorobiales bacterium]